jgi:short-subunit dehydrogenase
MPDATRPLAIITGASSGIGYELAKNCAESGFDLMIAADEPEIHNAADMLRRTGAEVEAIEADLATTEGVDKLCAPPGGRSATREAGRGLGDGFLEQDFEEIMQWVDTNITGTLYLLHKFGRDMRAQSGGRILITGSIAGFTPGTFQAVYNGTKAFLDSFPYALRNELKDIGVTVTCLMPGATETEFFERADMMDTEVGTQKKDDPADVAKDGCEAMMKGEGGIVSGWENKAQVMASRVMLFESLAEKAP